MKSLIEKVEEFWNEYDLVLSGEWNHGLSKKDWELLDEVRKALQ